MAKAALEQDGMGGLKVIVPAWDDKVIYEITMNKMAEICDEATEDGQSEPEWDLVTSITYEAIRDALNLHDSLYLGDLMQAVSQAVQPGPGFDKIKTFTV
jgi:hypothetical protein